MSARKVTVCHIQYDFNECIEEQEKSLESDEGFFINVDESLDSIREYKVKVSSGAKNTAFDIEDSKGVIDKEAYFKRVLDKREDGEEGDRNSLYELSLPWGKSRFQLPIRDFTHSIGKETHGWTQLDMINLPMERYILGDTQGDIRVYDGSFQLERMIEGAHADEISSLQFFPSGEVILSASYDMQIKLWSVSNGTNPRTFIGHEAKITDTKLIERGRNFVSSSTDGTIRLWECGSGSNIHTMTRRENPHDGINSLALLCEEDNNQAPDNNRSGNSINNGGNSPLEFGTFGKSVIAGHESGVITMHDLFSKSQQLQIPNEFLSPCNTLSYVPERPHYVYAGYENGTIGHWDLRFPTKSVDSFTVNRGTSINTIYQAENRLFVSSGVDTSTSLDITAEGRISTELPTFLVSNDCRVQQYVRKPRNNDIVAIGNWGFCAAFRV